MNLIVDLNADLGEGSGHDAELFELISSANIATGFHAGDSDTMHAAVSAAKEHGLQIAREVFADRNYMNDGWLVPRTQSNALLRDPKEAAERVLRMLREGKVRSVEGRDVDVRADTICVHGDTPGAVAFARELRMQLESHGVRISAPQCSL